MNETPTPTVTVIFDHNNDPDDKDIVIDGISSDSALPDKDKFLPGSALP